MAKKQPTHIEFTHPCPKPPPCALFDLDGTLVDTVPLIASCFNSGLKATGHRGMTTSAIAAILGPPLEALYALRVEKHQIDEACRVYRETFNQYFQDHVKAMPGAVALLEDLRSRGSKIGVCTNRHSHTEEILELSGLRPLIDAVVSVKDNVRPKPNPDMLYILMDKLDAIPAETAYVGDSAADMRAGEAAGLWTIGVQALGLDAHDLERAGAHVVAHDLEALPVVLGLVEPPPRAAPAANGSSGAREITGPAGTAANMAGPAAILS